MKATSFMSENTAAYALVPDLVAHLGEHFPRVIPVYFWLTREGARVGLESMGNQTVRVVGAYARRPTVIHPGDDRILVKINDLLFAAAREGAGFGIPVFAGVPLVNTLADFSLGVRCSWFHITSTSHAVTDSEFLLPVSEQPPMLALQEGISGPLTSAQIVEIAESECSELHWMEAAEGMRFVKSPEGIYARPFGGGYRPFFLVMPSN
jgi:hypothetical protein